MAFYNNNNGNSESHHLYQSPTSLYSRPPTPPPTPPRFPPPPPLHYPVLALPPPPPFWFFDLLGYPQYPHYIYENGLFAWEEFMSYFQQDTRNREFLGMDDAGEVSTYAQLQESNDLLHDYMYSDIDDEPPLSEEVINEHLKTRIFDLSADAGGGGDEEAACCAVCLCGYEEKPTLGVLGCGHDFHGGCVKKWLLRKNTCPLCRAKALDIY